MIPAAIGKLRVVSRGAHKMTSGSTAPALAALQPQAATLIEDAPLMGSSLVESWPAFVFPSKRMERQGPFLQSIVGKLPAKARILDAAMGIGCETIWLRQGGYDVVANEISQDFRDLAARNAREVGVSLDITRVDWRDLKKVFGPEAFDLIILVGNSFSLLLDPVDQASAVRNLARVCRTGGTVVVDERNFGYISRERSAILRGWFRYSREVIYCGHKVSGTPIAICGHIVRFSYRDEVSGRTLGELDMFPFDEGELCKLFTEGGFQLRGVFSDLKPGLDPEADFFSYLFERR